ncbi:MAG: 8-amino-7-oxononanoate synthase [Flammeovirgaceae bacterium]|nr:8-amino-7-oxononanoate synthase [Flammeovirgaceae bacterium]
MSELEKSLKDKLLKREQENSLRRLTFSANLIDFTSNDYLGLARSEELFRSIQQKVNSLSHSNGATGSRLLSGNNEYTEQVEQKLAKIFKAEAAVIFNSGYAANQAVLSCIPQKGDTIIYDELIHACIRDGARLSWANRLSFRHNDFNDLESKLKKSEGNIFIAVESIYSMDGDLCNVKELTALADKFNASIILDEAHSTGIMGEQGSGLSVSLRLENKIPIRIYTFGKAMGVHGACVVGSKNLIDYLINFARPFIYTTALPPHSIASIDCAFSCLNDHGYLQNELSEKVKLFRSEANKRKLSVMNSESQIQGIVIPGNSEVKQAVEKIRTNGFDVRPILSPTVPAGTERIRVCLHTFNANHEIQSLAESLSML